MKVAGEQSHSAHPPLINSTAVPVAGSNACSSIAHCSILRIGRIAASSWRMWCSTSSRGRDRLRRTLMSASQRVRGAVATGLLPCHPFLVLLAEKHARGRDDTAPHALEIAFDYSARRALVAATTELL